MTKSNKIFLLDPGHGGLIDGVYQTEGKRSPWSVRGFVLYEGEFTRAIVARLLKWAPLFDIECLNLIPENEDISLFRRVRRANAMAWDHRDKSFVYVSIHANAGGGHGVEIFTSIGQTASDAIATVFLDKLGIAFPKVRKRTDESDGDPDKEANFYVLRKTSMPAILTENFFMDNRQECEDYLTSETGRDRIAMAHLAAMVQIDKEG